MEKPGLFYLLPELAQRWGKTESDLLHLATDGKLAISIWVSGKFVHTKKSGDPQLHNCTSTSAIDDFDGLVRIPTDDTRKFLTKARVKISYFSDDEGDELMSFPGGEFLTRPGESRDHLPGYYGIEELCVTPGEVFRYEAEQHNIIDATRQSNLPGQSSAVDEAMCIVGQVLIEDFFKPTSWNTIKRWLGEKGYSRPDVGPWRVLLTDAIAIRSKKSSFIDKKRKNKK